MKKEFFKGHSLTDEVMKGICGGTLDIRTSKPEEDKDGYSKCTECGALVKYEEIDGFYWGFCERCGSLLDRKG